MKTRLLTYSKLRRLFLTDALRRSKVGDEVEVKVLRDGQPLTVSVRLEQHR
jgi:S1-C subfamily serine protease